MSFPASPGRNPELLRIARQHLPVGVRTIALDQLEADLAISRAETAQSAAVPVVMLNPVDSAPRRPYPGSRASGQ